MYLHRKYYATNHDTFSLFVGVEVSATWHLGLSRNGGHCKIVCWQSEADCAESKSDQMCEIRLSYPTWPSRWVLCISVQCLRLKGCHVTCDEWTSGEICSLQHMWVIGSVMWAAVSDESLKFGVQGATATNWFLRVNGMRDNGIWL